MRIALIVFLISNISYAEVKNLVCKSRVPGEHSTSRIRADFENNIIKSWDYSDFHGERTLKNLEISRDWFWNEIVIASGTDGELNFEIKRNTLNLDYKSFLLTYTIKDGIYIRERFTWKCNEMK